MPFADIDGTSIYYEEHGQGEPLLCIMGLGTDHVAWALQLEAFSANHRTIVFDNRDCGQSSRAGGPYALADMAADTLGLADHLGLDSFHLVGVSMGGAIAQHVALAAPERIHTLTLIVTWAGGQQGYAAEKARLWSSEAMLRPREEWVDALLFVTVSEDFYENAEMANFVKQVIRDNPYPQEPEAFGRQLHASSAHDLRGQLDALSALPVHVISGERDLLMPRWKQEELAAEIPGAKLTVIPGGSHALNLERPHDLGEAVLGFIAANASTAVTPG